MRTRPLAIALLVPALVASGCGSKTKNVNTASYSCAQFSQSLQSKGNNTAGNYINQLRKQAKLGQDTKTERREITLGIYFACRNKPGSTHPANSAIKAAQQIKAGTFKLPSGPKSKKKSGG
jgi:hypothetical protein